MQRSQLKLAVVTDIHHGPQSKTKMGPAAIGLLNEFVDFANDWGADIVIDLGDRISDRNNESDRALTADVAGIFQRIGTQRRHILGNHDLEYMTVEENEELLGVSMSSESIDVNGYHLVFWQADTHIDRDEGFHLNDDDLKWLAADLGATNLPTIVFSHVPLDGGDMTGNYYFEANPELARYRETEQIREVLTTAGNVVLCVAGHVHWNDLNNVDGIPYISMQSLTESFTTAPKPASAWSTIRIGEEIHWECYGADPVNIKIPTPTLGRRWVPPLPSFQERSRNTPSKSIDVLLSGVRGVLFDLDGVVYRGDEVIPGAPEFFAYLSETGRTIGAITNNALKTGPEYSDKLALMGIKLDGTSIFTSGWAAAQYVRESSETASVFLVGGDALRRELEAVGAVASKRPDFVVAAIDLTLPLQHLSDAVVHVRNGAQLVVTNPDLTVPIEGGLRAGAGAVQAFIEAAGDVKATVIGKPQAGIFLKALNGLGLNANETIMVGDTIDTDIRGAQAAKLRSVLVESGNVNTSNSTADIQVKDISELHKMFAIFDGQKGDLL
ncbi:MAG: hypothetical protein CMP14_07610 [Rickettsiales bacterium]|nr:hypothetical protein [Rickettsiales bacterium]